jgi:hypothetical protein
MGPLVSGSNDSKRFRTDTKSRPPCCPGRKAPVCGRPAGIGADPSRPCHRRMHSPQIGRLKIPQFEAVRPGEPQLRGSARRVAHHSLDGSRGMDGGRARGVGGDFGGSIQWVRIAPLHHGNREAPFCAALDANLTSSEQTSHRGRIPCAAPHAGDAASVKRRGNGSRPSYAVSFYLADNWQHFRWKAFGR